MAVDDQRITALHDHHVFIVIVHVLGRFRISHTSPECHLHAVEAIKDVAFDSRSRLARSANSIRRILHEIRKGVHVVLSCLFDTYCTPFHTILWNSSSIAGGDSFAPRSSHQRRRDSRLPANAEARASNSRCGTFAILPDSMSRRAMPRPKYPCARSKKSFRRPASASARYIFCWPPMCANISATGTTRNDFSFLTLSAVLMVSRNV